MPQTAAELAALQAEEAAILVELAELDQNAGAGMSPPPAEQDPAANNDRCSKCLKCTNVCVCVCVCVSLLSVIVLQVHISRRGHPAGGCLEYYTGPRHCQLAATMQMWDCGCENATWALLRTLGADGSPPDGAVSRTVRAWRGLGCPACRPRNATDVPEPRSAVSLGGIDAMYPWLNPTCANIGVHNGSVYCSNDPDFLLRRNTTSSPIPSQVPRDCVTWNDGCDTCGIVAAGGLGGDETMACGSVDCEDYDVLFFYPGCDPQTKPGRIDHTDPVLQRVLLNMVTSWYDQCPSASAATCTPIESRVECMVWAPEIGCLVMGGRPFLDGHQALQASARVEVGSDWIGASP